MRKKILTCIGVVAVLAVMFSVTAFAAAGGKLPEYNLVEIIHQELVMTLTAIFKTVDAIYIFFANLFG